MSATPNNGHQLLSFGYLLVPEADVVPSASIPLGQKRTWRLDVAMSALPPKADIDGRRLDVRFVPIADIRQSAWCGQRWEVDS
jgi:hypothetical protein